ncbi:hypothetical protein [Candidatus Thiosymbion oneisti]|uniref:hypothetical protein n=1 Tax=Candidatus Thiosymbion oneisti TaxID=589554 RepID=UPI00105E79B0|nr:hypothetical protein [Candidatus Thiosymbion oneisti]
MNTQRVVVFLDLLGFSNLVLERPPSDVVVIYDKLYLSLVETMIKLLGKKLCDAVNNKKSIDHDSHTRLLDSYVQLANDIQSGKFSFSKFSETTEDALPLNVMIVSDGLIIYTNSLGSYQEEFSAIETMIIAIRDLMVRMFDIGIYMRGAISIGEFIIDLDRNVYFGKAFIEAVRDESRQNWIGCILGKSVEDRLGEYALVTRLRNRPIRQGFSKFGRLNQYHICQYNVPIKPNNTENRWIVNWAGGVSSSKLIAKVEKSIENMKEHQEAHAAKWLHTLEYFKWYSGTKYYELNPGFKSSDEKLA